MALWVLSHHTSNKRGLPLILKNFQKLKKGSPLIVKLKNNGLEDGRYTDSDGHVWNVARLIQHAKGLPVFEIAVAGIHIGEKVFAESRTARDIAEHVKRVQETDLNHPILLDPDGFIMDGWHRVVKALVEGQETIKAVRFQELPVWEFQETLR